MLFFKKILKLFVFIFICLFSQTKAVKFKDILSCVDKKNKALYLMYLKANPNWVIFKDENNIDLLTYINNSNLDSKEKDCLLGITKHYINYLLRQKVMYEDASENDFSSCDGVCIIL